MSRAEAGALSIQCERVAVGSTLQTCIKAIRLDANDLFMSLAGPVAIAYAESVVPETPVPSGDKFKVFEKDQPRLDIDDLACGYGRHEVLTAASMFNGQVTT